MKLLSAFLLFILTSCAWAKHPNTARDADAIQQMQKLSAHTLDTLLPAIPFKTWLQSMVGDSVKLVWEINDCGEQVGTPTNRGSDNPICLNVVTSSRYIYLSIDIVIGTAKQGIGGKPVVSDVSVEKHGHRQSYVALSDLLISNWK